MTTKHYPVLKIKGDYDSTAHKGSGKAQKLLPPAVGQGYNKPTPHSKSAVVGEVMQAGKGAGYQTSAHTETHHGKSGQAMGHRDDIKPMKYDTPTHMEGRGSLDSHGGPNFTARMSSSANKAAHHPRAGEAHSFPSNNGSSSHGWGHSSAQRKGPLRMSGHQRGHRVGSK